MMTRKEIYDLLSNNTALKNDIKNHFKKPYPIVSTENLNKFLESKPVELDSNQKEGESSNKKENVSQSVEKKNIVEKISNVQRLEKATKLIADIKFLEKKIKLLYKYQDDIHNATIKETDDFPFILTCGHVDGRHAISSGILITDEIKTMFLKYLKKDIDICKKQLKNLNDTFNLL